MDSNINYKEITKYSQSFAKAVCDKFFENKDRINGEEILLLSPLQQINLFIIYELLYLWREENKKLKSPYFDYSGKEVNEAMTRLMNALSKNISVEQKDLEPLVVKATEKAILLIFSPYQFYRNEFDRPEKARLNYAHLKELSKYVKVNKHLLDHYIKRFEKENIEEIFNDDAIRIFDEVCENIKETPEDFEVYITMFNEVLMFDVGALYGGHEEGSIHNSHYEEDEEETPESQNINESLSGEVETLAGIHEKKGIEGIKKNITINQRFMFVNELFEGNTDEFESAVNYLDNCENREEALGFIEQNYVEGKGWDTESEEFEEFMYVVNRRFPEGK